MEMPDSYGNLPARRFKTKWNWMGSAPDLSAQSSQGAHSRISWHQAAANHFLDSGCKTGRRALHAASPSQYPMQAPKNWRFQKQPGAEPSLLSCSLLFVYSHSRFDQLPDQTCRQFLVQGQMDRRFCGYIIFQFGAVFGNNRRRHVEANVLFAQPKICQAPHVSVKWHPIADGFRCFRRGGLDYGAKLRKLLGRRMRSLIHVSIHLSFFRIHFHMLTRS